MVVVATVALVFGFLAAIQVRSERLLAPSSQLARAAALAHSVQDLEKTNGDYRKRIAAMRAELTALEAAAAQRSSADRALAEQLAALRELAGLTALRGPGVTVKLADGRPSDQQLPDHLGYRIAFEDIEDVANLLFAAGAEGVSVNGRRLTPLSSFHSEGRYVLIDQGPPISSPFTIQAVGDPATMETALEDTGTLPDVRLRVERFQLIFSWSRQPDLVLPAYDSSLAVDNARAP